MSSQTTTIAHVLMFPYWLLALITLHGKSISLHSRIISNIQVGFIAIPLETMTLPLPTASKMTKNLTEAGMCLKNSRSINQTQIVIFQQQLICSLGNYEHQDWLQICLKLQRQILLLQHNVGNMKCGKNLFKHLGFNYLYFIKFQPCDNVKHC